MKTFQVLAAYINYYLKVFESVLYVQKCVWSGEKGGGGQSFNPGGTRFSPVNDDKEPSTVKAWRSPECPCRRLVVPAWSDRPTGRCTGSCLTPRTGQQGRSQTRQHIQEHAHLSGRNRWKQYHNIEIHRVKDSK